MEGAQLLRTRILNVCLLSLMTATSLSSLARFRIVHLAPREKRKDSQNAMLPTLLSMQPRTKASRSEIHALVPGHCTINKRQTGKRSEPRKWVFEKQRKEPASNLHRPPMIARQLSGKDWPSDEKYPHRTLSLVDDAIIQTNWSNYTREAGCSLRLAGEPSKVQRLLLRWCFKFRNYLVVSVSGTGQD